MYSRPLGISSYQHWFSSHPSGDVVFYGAGYLRDGVDSNYIYTKPFYYASDNYVTVLMDKRASGGCYIRACAHLPSNISYAVLTVTLFGPNDPSGSNPLAQYSFTVWAFHDPSTPVWVDIYFNTPHVWRYIRLEASGPISDPGNPGAGYDPELEDPFYVAVTELMSDAAPGRIFRVRTLTGVSV